MNQMDNRPLDHICFLEDSCWSSVENQDVNYLAVEREINHKIAFICTIQGYLKSTFSLTENQEQIYDAIRCCFMKVVRLIFVIGFPGVKLENIPISQ